MSEVRCRSCFYWVPMFPDQEHNAFGECRRYAPEQTDSESTVSRSWPRTFDHDWCGEWTKRDTKYADFQRPA